MGPSAARRTRALFVGAAAALVVVSLPSTASASVATSCSFDAGTATVTATIGSTADVTLVRSGDAITFGGAPCGSADVHNTDLIVVNGPDDLLDESLTVSLAGGPFAPGLTSEADGSSEIEMIVNLVDDAFVVQGSDGADSISMRGNSVDLDAATGVHEQEISMGPNTYYTARRLEGGAGDDELAVDCRDCPVFGDAGNDTLYQGQNGGVEYHGGEGEDTLSLLNFSPGTIQVLSAGVAELLYVNTQVDYLGFERYVGGEGQDTFLGSPDADVFDGAGGNDLFRPRGGDDTIEGGDGVDELFEWESSPITVDLSSQTVDGLEGHDTFADVEALQGGPYDDAFVGDPVGTPVFYVDGVDGRDVLDFRTAGHGQRVAIGGNNLWGSYTWATFFPVSVQRVLGSPLRDRIVVATGSTSTDLRYHLSGFGGDDGLVGGNHHDVLEGGAGDDHLDGRQGRDICDGGPGVNEIVNCEV